MAFTCRLSPDLHERAVAYSRRMGIPLASLMAVSLSAYLDANAGPPEADRALPATTPSLRVENAPAAVPDVPSRQRKRAAARTIAKKGRR